MPATLTRRPPPWSPWRPRADGAPPAVAVRPSPALVAGIKAFHTFAWGSIESCVLYVLYAGLRGRTDRRAGIAGGIVAGEVLVFVGNGFRCPLTDLAERYGGRAGVRHRHLLAEVVRAQHAGHPHAAARPHDLPACTQPAAAASWQRPPDPCPGTRAAGRSGRPRRPPVRWRSRPSGRFRAGRCFTGPFHAAVTATCAGRGRLPR
jgi:hypothetical protein